MPGLSEDTIQLLCSESGALPKSPTVLRFSSHEGFSMPYRIALEFSTEDHGFDVDRLIQKRLVLGVPGPGGKTEYLGGQVFEARFVRAVAKALHFEVVLRPAIFALAFRENSRVFTGEESIPEIVKLLVKEAGFEPTTKYSLFRTHAKREFTVQHRESSLNFIQRLCEDVGIFYYFTHTASEDKLVFCDDLSQLPDPPDELAYTLGDLKNAAAEPLLAITRREKLRTSDVSLRDFNIENPVVFSEAAVPASSGPSQPVFHYPGGFVEPDEGKLRARARLLSLRHDVEIFEGEVGAAGPLIGGVAELSGSAEPDLNQKVRFVELFREGIQHSESAGARAMQIAFRAVRSDSEYLPPWRARRPRIHGIQTAVVVGEENADQSIETERLGRVKVRFHWDRLSPANTKASCWIRVSQVHLGGSMILPRVGWEVAVAFLEGDPDRPIVLGKVYNSENMPPLSLPDAKASGSFSSKSSPGGAGGNELSMGDSGGSQGLSIKAQKDLNVATGFDQTEDIKVDDESQVNLNLSRTVKVNDTVTVSGNQSMTVGAHHCCTVKGSQTVSISGNEVDNSKANYLEKVTGNRSVSIGGNQMMLSNGERMTITGDAQRTVGAVEITCTASNLSQNIGAAASSSVGAVRLHLTGGDHGEVVAGAKSVTIAGAAAYVVKGSRLTTCEGAVAHLVGGIVQRKVKGTFTLKAPMISIVGGTGKLKGGSSEVSLAGGPITMKGGKITIKAAIIKKTAGSIKLG